MSILNSLSRLAEYYRRHGSAATLRRATLAAKRALFANRMAVFYCDLDEQKLPRVNVPKAFRVVRLTSLEELTTEHLQAMTGFWNPKLANRNVRQGFEKGASLWLVECAEQLAGYGWTLRGKTIAPYYFPLGKDDVQLFDFYVFPKFRGRALHWLLTGHILHTLASEGRSRAFADTGEWNQAQLASFKMTPFRFLGFVRTHRVLGHILNSWTRDEIADREQKITLRKDKGMKVLRPNE
jgi:hypothetical protein